MIYIRFTRRDKRNRVSSNLTDFAVFILVRRRSIIMFSDCLEAFLKACSTVRSSLL